jgi:hypothetical protein
MSDYLTSSLPLILAIGAIIVSFSVVYYSKRRELELRVFEELCASQLADSLDELGYLISSKGNNHISNHLGDLSSILNHLLLKLIAIRGVYETININDIQEKCHSFMDGASTNQAANLSSLIGEFYILKADLTASIFKYAMSDIFSFRKNVIGKAYENVTSLFGIAILSLATLCYVFLFLMIFEIYFLLRTLLF